MPFPLPIEPADLDGDGIDDALELALAERFAPVILMSKDETNLPVNVGWFLARATLEYYERSWGPSHCTPPPSRSGRGRR
jgi:hypothetical protein